MQKITLVTALSVFFFLVSCGKVMFVDGLSGSAILKDKSVLNYELLLEFENQKGLDEFIEKRDRINQAIRIILVYRTEEQIDKQSRLISLAIKIFKSQLNEPVKRITVKTFKIDKLI